MIEKERERLTALFKKEVDDHAEAVDPDQEEDWGSLTLGWALAKGVPPDEAREFASHIRYKTEFA